MISIGSPMPGGLAQERLSLGELDDPESFAPVEAKRITELYEAVDASDGDAKND